jgi:hypothetical protein
LMTIGQAIPNICEFPPINCDVENWSTSRHL